MLLDQQSLINTLLASQQAKRRQAGLAGLLAKSASLRGRQSNMFQLPAQDREALGLGMSAGGGGGAGHQTSLNDILDMGTDAKGAGDSNQGRDSFVGGIVKMILGGMLGGA